MALSSWQATAIVHLMKKTNGQMVENPQSKPIDLGCEYTSSPLPSTSTIIYYYYSVQKLISHFTVPLYTFVTAVALQ